MRGLSRYLAVRIADQQQVIANLVTVDSEQRLGKTLLQLARTLGKKDPRSTRIELKISHEELSEMVGTTRPRISLFMQRFRNLGLIETNLDRFLVINENKLTDYLTLDRQSGWARLRAVALILVKPVQLLDSKALYQISRNVISNNREVTYYGTNIIDRLDSAPVWRSAPLGLSLVWLRSLGHRRDDINYRPDSVPVGPNLRVLSVVRPSGSDTDNHIMS